MDDDAAALCCVEQLLTEFFNPLTSNERKKSIEQNLNDFSNQPSSWKSCLNFLSATNNQFVCMYALSALESFMEKKWIVLPWDDKNLIKSSLYSLSLEPCNVSFIRNKLVKLVTQIAKYDWPQSYPHYFDNILQLLSNKDSRQLGLMYLRTASEELICPKEELPVTRKNELLQLFSAQIPQVFNLLANILIETITLYNRSGTATPPPSPTSSQIPLQKNSILDVNGLSGGQGEICIETLKVLAHIFGWLSVADYVSSSFLELLFRCAVYHNTMTSRQVEIAIQAMTTINELLYKHFSSESSIKLLLGIYENAVQIFQKVERLDIVDDCYTDKLTEFLQLFASNHLKVMESHSEFSTKLFLELLYNYTFQKGVTMYSYLQCLEIWNSVLNVMQSKCSDIALIIAEQIFQKISFKTNGSMLNNFDMESFNENEETEWTQFLRCSIECVSRIADILPIPVFNMLYQAWKEEYTLFGNFIVAFTSGQKINLNDENIFTVRAHFRDLASVTQALARISHLFIGDQAMSNFQPVEELVSQTIDILMFTKDCYLIKLCYLPEKISASAIEGYAQLLASLQAWSQWVAQKSDRDKLLLSQRLVDSCIWIISQNLTVTCPPIIVHAATHLLQTITAILKPNLWGKNVFITLIHTVEFANFKFDTARVLRRALVNGIILPQGDHNERHKLLNSMVQTHLKLLGTESHRLASESSVVTSMTALKEILEDCDSSSTVIKKMLHICYEPCINRGLQLLPLVLNHQIISEVVLSFLHVSFSVLQHQIGPTFIQNSVENILQLYIRENISQGPALDKLLEILILIVSSPSSGFKAFLPSVTSLCLTHIWPVVNTNMTNQPDTSIVFLRLFYSILLHQWQYYFNISVIQKFESSNEEDLVQHKDELVNILEIFGHALSQSDVNIFRQSLQSLEQLNSKWGLYKRDIFKNHLLHRFVSTLFTTLLQRSHNLLADEITISIHSLATVDFDWFANQFLTFFLTNCEGLSDGQRSILLNNFDKSTDQPTMTRSVLRLVSDIRYYQMSNLR